MQYFAETIPDFFRFMVDEGRIKNAHTRNNYVYWLKFLDRQYGVTDELTDEDIERIIESEEGQRQSRDFYTTKHDLVNFKSALRKYKAFATSDYRASQVAAISQAEKIIREDVNISQTEKESLIKARIGQGPWRNNLIKYWHGCSVCSIEKYDLLIASHIKPWRDSDNVERLDVMNGLLLVPTLDKLFDRGYLTFNDNGEALLSDLLTRDERETLGLGEELHVRWIEDRHKPFLRYHRENCFM